MENQITGAARAAPANAGRITAKRRRRFDAPLGEETEAYRVLVQPDGGLPRTAQTGDARYVYTAADQMADGGDATRLEFSVSQLSAAAGAGVSARKTFILDIF